MASSVTHSFVSTVPDGADASLVQPGDWNAGHDFTLDASDVVVVPVGTITAVDVQAAIEQLDSKVVTGGGTGDVSADTIWDAKGDLAVGTGADTAIGLGVGTDGQVLVADSGEASGLRWADLIGITIPITMGTAGPVVVTTEADNPPPFRWYNDTGVTLAFAAIRASATVGPNGSTSTIDVNVNGSSIMTGTKVVLPNNSGAASTIKVVSFTTTTIADGSYLSYNVDTAGGGSMANLQITVWMVG